MIGPSPPLLGPDMPAALVDALRQLDYLGTAGLVTKTQLKAPDEYQSYIWDDLKAKIGLDAAFFQDGIPLVGFSSQADGPALHALRRRLWNYGKLPLLINVENDGQMAAYNAVRNPDIRDSNSVLARQTTRDVAQELLSTFSRRHIASGDFANRFDNSYRHATTVDNGLLTNLRYLRINLPDPTEERVLANNALIGGAIVATYLAHRGVLTTEHISDLSGWGTLEEILYSGVSDTSRFFQGLANKFNGDVFGELIRSMPHITVSDLRNIADFLRGDDLAIGQGRLWPYDFSIVPADLVSSVYEQLLESERHTNATYYTPRLIVNLVLDEVMPLAGKDLPTVVDLACGSGAFINEAYRRLIHRAKRRRKSLGYDQLSALLKDHIFGVDINDQAARVTIFGLYLTLLEQVDPPTIWDSVVLPQMLGTNIIASDAFASHPLARRKFHVVVSNPPWKSALTSDASTFVDRSRLPVGDQQAAQAFTWLAYSMLRPGGRLGLVMPAKGLLHNKSQPNVDFRRALFTETSVVTIADLSALRRTLFPNSIAPTAILVAARKRRNMSTPSIDNDVIYVAPHYRRMSSAVDALIVTPEEVQTVSSREAAHIPDLWKVMLWGSRRDLRLIERLRTEHPTLQQVIKAEGLRSGQGYKVAPNLDQDDASFIHGWPEVDIHSVSPLGNVRMLDEPFSRSTLHRPRSESRYIGPHVLISRTLPGNRLSASVLNTNAVFTSNITSIAGDNDQLDLLQLIAASLVSTISQYWQFMTSSSWGVERETVETSELLTMPIPLDAVRRASKLRALFDRARKNGPSEELLELLDDVVFAMYGLTDSEQIRIRQSMDSAIRRFTLGPKYPMAVSVQQLRTYRETVGRTLSLSLPDLTVETDIARRESYVAVIVRFEQAGRILKTSNVASIDWDFLLRQLSPGQSTTAVMAQPAGFFVDGDIVYVIKTADSDRWSFNAALDDADRIFSALAFGRASAF